MDYFEDLESWVPFWSPEETLEVFHEALCDSLRNVGTEDCLPTPEAMREGMDSVLFGFSSDEDLTLFLYVIPLAELSGPLRSAMALVTHSGYAYDELMLGDEKAKAYMRLEIAFGTSDWEEILEEFEEIVPEFGAQVGETERACLAPYLVGRLEHGEEPSLESDAFAKRFVGSYMVRRSQ